MSFDEIFNSIEHAEKQTPLMTLEKFEKLCSDVNKLFGIKLKNLIKGLGRNRNFYVAVNRRSDVNLELKIRNLLYTNEEFELEIESPSGSKKWRIPFRYMDRR